MLVHMNVGISKGCFYLQAFSISISLEIWLRKGLKSRRFKLSREYASYLGCKHWQYLIWRKSFENNFHLSDCFIGRRKKGHFYGLSQPTSFNHKKVEEQ